MCGIAGIIDLSNDTISKKKVHLMISKLERRGPDHKSVLQLQNAVLGHSRLSILDLSKAGNQPMSSTNNRYTITYNGEIYNHKDLRSKLERVGYRYRSNSDTESLINGYAHYGVDFFTMCRGMWAYGIWDSLEKTLILCRDRVGEKPIFYIQNGLKLSFSSSLSGLKPAMDSCDISDIAVSSLMSYQCIPQSQSIYKGVKKIPPGHYMIFNRKGLKIKPYWELNYQNKLSSITLDEAKENTLKILESAIKEQLEADVQVGTFLSGGIDSGIITSIAADYKPGIISTTMTLPNNDKMNESENAKYISSKFHTEHVEVPLKQDCIKELPNLLSHIEPFADSSIIPASAVSREAAKHMKVVLTGDGGDESFDGYKFGRLGLRGENIKNSKSYYFLKMFSPVLSYLSKQSLMPIFRLLRLSSSGSNLMAAKGLNSWLKARDRATMDVKNILFGDKLKSIIHKPSGSYLIKSLETLKHDHWWEALLGLGFKTTLVDDFLMKVDTATMFHSLEARSPFLDHRLIDFATQIPYNILFSDEHSKSILRIIASEKISHDIAYSAKKGFSLPVEEYFLKGWGKMLIDLINDGLSAQYNLINPKSVPTLLQKHGLNSNYKLGKLLFSILSLEIWLRVFHDQTDDPNELGERICFALK